MLNLFRWSIAFFIIAPFAFLYCVMSLFVKKKRAESIVGPILTSIAALIVELSLPRIHCKEEYQIFQKKVIRNLTIFAKPLYDVEVQHKNKGSVEFKILNCHMVGMLKKLGTNELCKYVCAGDFEIAQKNESKWQFKRTHAFGIDGECCNHTYSAVDSAINPDKKNVKTIN